MAQFPEGDNQRIVADTGSAVETPGSRGQLNNPHPSTHEPDVENIRHHKTSVLQTRPSVKISRLKDACTLQPGIFNLWLAEVATGRHPYGGRVLPILGTDSFRG